MKYAAAAAFGCHNYPVGLLDGGRTFCPEQALVDLDIAEMVDREFSCAQAADIGELVAVIREAGIGGSYLGLTHTVQHYREASWRPAVLLSGSSAQAETDMSRTLVATRDQIEALLGATRSAVEPTANWEAIEAIVAEAERLLKTDG